MNRQLPNGWGIESFQKVVFDKTGGNLKVKQRDYRKSGVLPVIDQGQTCVAGYVDDVSLECKAARPCIIFGDHTKTLKFVDTPFVLGADGTKVLVPSSKLYPKYLYYYLRQVKLPDDVGYSRHFKFLKEVMIPIPPLDTQKRIADALDKAQEVIDKRKQQIELMDDFLQSVFLDMFGDPGCNPNGWVVRKLQEVCLGKGEYGSGSSAIPYSKEKPRYIRITDIEASGGLTGEKVSPSLEEDYKKYRLVEGDILFARSGATVGKTYLYTEKDGFCIFAGYLIRFKPNPKIVNPQYLFHFTKTTYYHAWVQSKQKVVAQPNINARQYGLELDLPVPPMQLQCEFTKITRVVHEQKRLMERSLVEMHSNFNSIMQRAFKGELFS